MTNEETLKVFMDEGVKLHEEDRYVDACDAFARAVRFAETSWSCDTPHLVGPLVHLAMAVSDRETSGHGQSAEVLDLERRALSIVRGHFGEDVPQMSYVLEKIGRSLWKLGKHDEARARLEHTVEIFSKIYGDVPQSAYRLGMLTDLLLEMARPAEALPISEHALRIEEMHGHTTVGLMMALIGLGRCLRDLGRLAEAASHFERALAVRIARRPLEFKGEDFVSRELRKWIAEARGTP